MKINNKHTTEKGIEQRLQSYKKQASAYQYTKPKRTVSTSRLMRSSLLALAPLAAQSIAMPTLRAQCSAGVLDLSDSNNTASCIKIARVDLDGDGVYDFGIGVQTSFIFATGINPASTPSIAADGVYAVSAYSAANVAYNATASIQMFEPTKNTAGIGIPFVLSTNGGGGNFYTPAGSTSSGYLTINMGGRYGFIEITISRSATGERCISFGDIGLETIANTQTVLVGNCSTLPVELSSFKAHTTDNSILLNWETQSEYQNAGFELQRSTDAQDFRKIAWIDGAGTTSETQRYQFKDEKVIANQLYYYRLKQIDEDGSFEYSNIINATIQDKDALHVGDFYPNPSTTKAQFDIQANSNTDATIQLFDNTASLVRTLVLAIEKGINTLEIEVDQLPEGIYFARIDILGERIYRKISVVR